MCERRKEEESRPFLLPVSTMVSPAPAQVSSAKPRPLTLFGCQSSRLPNFDLLRFHLHKQEATSELFLLIPGQC